MRHTASLRAHNDLRRQAAAEISVAKSREALDILKTFTPTSIRQKQMHERQLRALRIRVAHPDSTLAVLADEYGTSKDSYWSLLRRGLLRAGQIREAIMKRWFRRGSHRDNGFRPTVYDIQPSTVTNLGMTVYFVPLTRYWRLVGAPRYTVDQLFGAVDQLWDQRGAA